MDSSLHHQFAEIERDHWWFQGRRHVVASVLAEHLGTPTGGADRRPPTRILDVGCGTGEMVDMLRAFGTVTAIDPSPDAVAACRERFGDEVEVAVGTVPDDLPGPGAADVVTAFDVIEHLDDDAGALRRIHDVLAPAHGTLVVTVPAFAFLWGAHDVLAGHRRRYTAQALRSRLTDAGFAVERLSYFNCLLFPVVALVRPLRRLVKRGTGPPRSDFTMPPRAVNRALLALFASEAAVLRRRSLPVGVSILAVCRAR
jgi:SAM-dependent methyltransferase